MVTAMVLTSKQAPPKAEMVVMLPISSPGQPMFIQSLHQLLVKLCGVLVIRKGQARLAGIELKSMEKRAVGVVLESLVYFLIP